MDDKKRNFDRPNQAVQPATGDVAEAADAALSVSNVQLAVEIITEALIQRAAALLMISAEDREADRSVAYYGIDSLIAVELGSGPAMALNSNVPLLGLLDEESSLRKLAECVVEERGRGHNGSAK